MERYHADAMAGSRSPLAIASGGLAALAVAIGIGRFVYTPILPFMAEGLGLSPAESGLVASANLLGHLVGALAAAWVRMPGGRRLWLLSVLALSAVTTAAMGLTAEMLAFLALRFAGGLASAFAIVLATGLVLNRLAATGRSGLSWMPFAGVGAGIALSAVLVSGMAADGAEWESLWLASGALALLGLVLCAYLLSETPAAERASPSTGSEAAAPGFPALVIAYGLFGFGYVITATFISQMVRTAPEVAALEGVVWLVVGLAVIPSVALWVWLDRRLGNCTALALACLVEGVGIAASVFESSAVAVLSAATVLGGTFMGITALGLIIAQRMSTGNPTRLLALMTASFGLGQMVGPTFAGYAYRIGDSFQVPSLAAAVALLVAAALTFRIRA